MWECLRSCILIRFTPASFAPLSISRWRWDFVTVKMRSVGFTPIQAFDIVSHFFTEESGHLNDPLLLGVLGVGNHILALNPLVGLWRW